MHEKAKQRIAEAKKHPDKRPALFKHLPKTGPLFDRVKNAITKLIDDTIDTGEISQEDVGKLIRLKTKIDIEL